ncbi:MAG: electron transporter RnfE [Gammaproteobacteria bacterium RBG_16_37_9]|nr:MAG: electron transporter RnfE [Gammaproteobacteria bacterium RBG_16_37_9]
MIEEVNHMWGIGMGFGWIFMILFWTLVILAIISLARGLFGEANLAKKSPHPEKAPLEILKERYARGEIDKKEFDEKKHDLQG